jgi:Glycosyl hydrolase family 9
MLSECSVPRIVVGQGLQCCHAMGQTLAGVKAAAADTSLPAASSATYSYTEGLHKTLIFFESMRSGKLDRQRLAWYAGAADSSAAVTIDRVSVLAHASVSTHFVKATWCSPLQQKQSEVALAPAPATSWHMLASCRRSDSCEDCVGPEGEDVSGGYYEAGGSFLKLGLVEAFLVRHLSLRQQTAT